ncbi:unnamed protein product [Prorocentrum cordatum]|uniref:Uncharacterized protein n=1 Tax=Prorocentrum cordatum TaxID=2364126 RepID=A0ABN9VWY2_9DINO|nr:unnamed protein product [Polarella glacialis]
MANALRSYESALPLAHGSASAQRDSRRNVELALRDSHRINMSRLRTSRTSGSTGDRQSGQSESRDRFGLPTTKRSNETSSHRRRNPYLPGGIQWPPPARHTPAPPRAEPAPPGGASAPGAPSRASPQGGSWVWGSLLAQVAAVLHTLGMVGVRAVLRRGKEAARWRPLLRLSFWKAVLLRTLACQVWWAARCCAPDTTVAPVFLGFPPEPAGGRRWPSTVVG